MIEAWLEFSPIFNYMVVLIAILNAMQNGPILNRTSSACFMGLFANIFVSFFMRVLTL